MAKKKAAEKYQRWIEARKRCLLSHTHIQRAKELGLHPKKLGSLRRTLLPVQAREVDAASRFHVHAYPTMNRVHAISTATKNT